MEKSKTNLLAQLQQREQSLDQYRHTQAQMTKVHQDMSESMRKLQQEHASNAKELERLRSIERRRARME